MVFDDSVVFGERRPRPSIALPLRTELGGRFAIGRLLGRPGGFGITYLALDLRLHRVVALKEFFPRALAARHTDSITVVPQTHDDDEQLRFGLERFLHEARTLARFDHPGIVRVQDFFEANGTAYLVMPYYEGETLEAYLRGQPDGRLNESTAVTLMLRVLDSLRVVHEAGLLHRDIKPENIYLRYPTGQPTLLDFGSAHAETAQRSMTIDRALTPGYAAAEQYNSDDVQGPWTDVYACGATLYRLLTAEVPLAALSRLGPIDPLRPITQIAPHVSDAVARSVTWALQPQRTARPQSAQALQGMLSQAAAADSADDAMDGLSPTLPVREAMLSPTLPVRNAELAPTLPVREASQAASTPALASVGFSKRGKAFVGIGAASLILALGAAAGLQAGVAVDGYVHDTRGVPLTGVVIELTSDGQTRTATTNSSGQYTFRRLNSNREYSIAARHPGYHLTTSDANAYVGQVNENSVISFDARTLAEAYTHYAVRGDSIVLAGYEASDDAAIRTGLLLLNTALDIFPDSSLPRVLRGVARWWTGDFAGCVQDMNRVPAAERAASILNWCHLGAGDFDAAFAGFTQRAANNDADAYVGLAVWHYRRGAQQAAIDNYRQAARIRREFAAGRDSVAAASFRFNTAEWAAIEAIRELYVRAWAVPYQMTNECRRPVRLAVRFQQPNGIWRTVGWWNLSVGAVSTLDFVDGTRATSVNPEWFFYAESTDGSEMRWVGAHSFEYEGRTLRMHRVNTGNVHRLTCP